MDIGYVIKKIRETKHYSQQEVADSLGISQKTYSNYESCKSVPSINHLCQLSILLEFDIIQCLKDNGISFYEPTSDSEKDNMISSKNFDKYSDLNNYVELLKSKDSIISLLKEKINWLQKNNKKANKKKSINPDQ